MNQTDENSRGILGIDAGGTFTDLALVAGADSHVIASAKTPTSHVNMAGTIEQGLRLILQQIRPEQIKAVNLATTHATNAIVENKLKQCALIVIGYSPDSVEQYKSQKEFGTDLVFQVHGGHDAKGNEEEPFDEAEFSRICDEILPNVECVAVSSYFSVRNPAHELRAREIILSKSPHMNVTCGHELASDLNALKRATTAALNAGLIPIIIGLFDAVEKVCKELGLNVPITIVRGDGSLVSVEWARQHPIETVLSGPAASSIGACFLAGAQKTGKTSCAVDIGGTTTDIIYLGRDGKPEIGTEGTTVGGHKTLVKSIDIYTFGLGGDSRVRFDVDRNIVIGPRRVKPICVAASDYPQVRNILASLAVKGIPQEPLIIFAIPGAFRGSITEFEARTLERLKDGPCALAAIAEKERRSSHMAAQQVEEMERRGLVEYAGFTPTDALHVLGRLGKWDAEASRQAAAILSIEEDETIENMCRRVCRKVSQLAAKNVFKKNLMKEIGALQDGGEGDRLIDLALSDKYESPLIKLNINAALIGVGAPAWAFSEEIGKMLSLDSILPENAGVAGAVGAAVGTFSQRYAMLITPLPSGEQRVHLPTGIKDFASLEAAVSDAEPLMRAWVTERSKKAGAMNPVVRVRREDEDAWIEGGIRKIHLRTQLFFEVEDKK